MALAAVTFRKPVPPPSMLLALTELPRALGEWASLPFASSMLATASHGDGHPVLVLPGFATTDASTKVLRKFLTRLGYDAHTWTSAAIWVTRRSGGRERSWSLACARSMRLRVKK